MKTENAKSRMPKLSTVGVLAAGLMYGALITNYASNKVSPDEPSMAIVVGKCAPGEARYAPTYGLLPLQPPNVEEADSAPTYRVAFVSSGDYGYLPVTKADFDRFQVGHLLLLTPNHKGVLDAAFGKVEKELAVGLTLKRTDYQFSQNLPKLSADQVRYQLSHIRDSSFAEFVMPGYAFKNKSEGQSRTVASQKNVTGYALRQIRARMQAATSTIGDVATDGLGLEPALPKGRSQPRM